MKANIKRMITLVLAVVFLTFPIVGCTASDDSDAEVDTIIELEVGQYEMTVDETGGLTVKALFSSELISSNFNVAFDQPVEDMKISLEEQLEVAFDEIDLNEVIKEEDAVYFEFYMMDGQSFIYSEMDYTIDDYMFDNELTSYVDVVNYIQLLEFETGEAIDAETLSESRDAILLHVQGSDVGVIIEVPGDILFVQKDFNYEVIDDNRIIMYGSAGILIYQ